MDNHTCHHPHCTQVVPPRMLACKAHWFALPKHLRDAIWATYRPGQEKDKKPSPAYLQIFEQCQAYWLKEGKGG